MVDLTHLGLTAYESKAYLMLVREGVSSAHEIAQKSGVPYGKIYPTLASLEIKGFLRKYASSPQRFVAVEPKIVFEAVQNRKEQELKHWQQGAHRLLQSIGELAERKSQEPLERIRVIEGYKNYLNLSVTLHDKAKSEWRTISRIPLYQPHLDAYQRCVHRGVQVRVLTQITPENKKNVAAWKKTGVELRALEELPGRFSVMDNSNVVIRISGEGKYLALWIQSQSLAKSSQNYFDYLWKKAQPL